MPPVRTRQVAGRLTRRDYPRAAARAGVEGTVVARLAIGPDGRVADCRVRVSSGDAALDETTCRLIVRRFRFQPARDAGGRPTADAVEWHQLWSLRPEPGPEADEADCRAEADRAPGAAERRAAFAACMAARGWTR